MNNLNEILRQIPRVDDLAALAAVEPEAAKIPQSLLLAAVRSVLNKLRADVMNGLATEIPPAARLAAKAALAAQSMVSAGLRPLINATGIVVHTNLGRSILPIDAAERITALATDYSTLEYDLTSGERGSRLTYLENLLTHLTGGEAALAVNNNAAAVLLILTAICRDKEVIVSRGELVEIGGSFRIPEIMACGGAVLKEVGTTNKTRLSDYAKAIEPEKTGCLLKVHPSNFKIMGYTESVTVAELASLAREKNLPLVCDLGSGSLVDLRPFGLTDEPTAGDWLASGADIVCFSGDKLLGGVQAGIIIGKQSYIKKLKDHPLARAMRLGKLTIVALEAILELYLDPADFKKIPTLAMLSAQPEELYHKAQALMAGLQDIQGFCFTVEQTESETGGGAAPAVRLPSWGIYAEPLNMKINHLEKALRSHKIPIISRIWKDRLVLDVRTIRPDQFSEIAEAFKEAAANQPAIIS